MLLNKRNTIFHRSIWNRMLSYLKIFLGWVFIIPISYLIPKKKQRIVVIGKEGKLFIDNSKYFFLYCKRHGINVNFVTENKAIAKTLRDEGLPNILTYPNFKTIWFLLRAEFLVVDSFGWADKMRYYFLFRAKKIQLWHGVSSKKIGMENTVNRHSGIMRKFAIIKGVLSGSIPYYKAIISTSEYFAEHLYRRAFRYNKVLSLGQARNDLFFREVDNDDLICADAEMFSMLKDKQASGYKIILYTPTFRDTGGDFIRDNAIDITSFHQFCEENKLCFIIKLHPYADSINIKKSEYFQQVNPFDDIYPIMQLVDMMITDYSSIYIDFLLTDRPI
ncbi:MAG: CDP-glycerol glycerophosphotransferase family protein, partial [Bacteroidota bacterium]|nr:CDP-glycerol glycerophosphotransferase family protein [Bacteroidota bacterium]